MPVEHTMKLRVRFAETDAMQVVYYAEYFVWFEVGEDRALQVDRDAVQGHRGRGASTCP